MLYHFALKNKLTKLFQYSLAFLVIIRVKKSVLYTANAFVFL